MDDAQSSDKLRQTTFVDNRSRIVRTSSEPNLTTASLTVNTSTDSTTISSSTRAFKGSSLKRVRSAPSLLLPEREPCLTTDSDSEIDLDSLLVEEPRRNHQIDFKFLLHAIASLRGYIIPMNCRRAMLYGLYIGIMLLFFCTDFFSYAQEAALSNITLLMIASFLVEPAYLLFMASKVDYSEVERLNRKIIADSLDDLDLELGLGKKYDDSLPGPVPITIETLRDPRYDNKDIGVIITCHNSEKEIIATVRGMLRHFFPSQIIISDNGSTKTDRTRKIVKQIHKNIVYIEREEGNKTGAQILAAYVSQFKFSLLCDDDTVVGPNFTPDTQLINEIYKGVCYPIKAKGKYKDNLITRWQKMEYMISDGTRYALRGGAIHFHGALFLVETNILRKILEVHPSEFIAEDLIMNIFLNRLRNEDGQNYQVAMSYQEPIETEAPMSFIGTPPNLAEQRVRWETGRLSHIRYFFMALFFTKPQGANSFISQKLDQIYEIYSSIGEFTKILLFGLVGHSPHFWLRFGIYIGITSIIAPYWNLQLRGSKAKGVDWFTASTYFIYRLLLYPFTLISVCNTLLGYLPVCKENPQFRELQNTVLDRDSLIKIYEKHNKGSYNRDKWAEFDDEDLSLLESHNSLIEDHEDREHIRIVIDDVDDDHERLVVDEGDSVRPSEEQLQSASNLQFSRLTTRSSSTSSLSSVGTIRNSPRL